MPGFASLRLPFLRWIFFVGSGVLICVGLGVWVWGVVLVRALYAFAPRGRPSIRCGVPFFEIRPSPRGEPSILEVRGFFFSLVCLAFARLYTKVW